MLSYQFFYYTLLALGAFLCFLYWYQTKNFTYWKSQGVPYLDCHWFYGSIMNESLLRGSWNAFTKKVYGLFKDNGVGGIFIFRRPVLIICDPKLIERVLMQDFELFHDRLDASFEEPLLQSLFFATGEKWRNMRIKLGQSFSSKKVQNMFDQILKCSDNVMCEICGSVNEMKSIQMEPLAFSFATEVIASCAFGLQFPSGSVQGKRFRDVMEKLFDINLWKIVKLSLKMFNSTIAKWLNIKYTDNEVEIYILKMCRDATDYRKRNQIQRNDILNLMITSKEQEPVYKHISNYERFKKLMKIFTFSSSGNQVFNERVIASVMYNFFQAGIKPVEITLSFALFEIAKNPDVQKCLREDIKWAVNKNKGWTYEAIGDMTYLDQVIQETLRLHSYNSNIVRTATQRFTIPNTSITLEKGMQVYIPASAIHMDPQYYPSPEVFNPDRFKGNNYKSSSCYMPFGAGPRICVSIRLAVTMMKVYLARLLAKYSVKIDEENMQLPLKLDEKVLFPKAIGGISLILESSVP